MPQKDVCERQLRSRECKRIADAIRLRPHFHRSVMFLVLACASFFTTPPSGRLATANIDWHEMGFVKEIKLNPKVAPTTRSTVAWSYDPEPEDVHWHEMGLVRTLRVKDARARTTELNPEPRPEPLLGLFKNMPMRLNLPAFSEEHKFTTPTAVRKKAARVVDLQRERV